MESDKEIIQTPSGMPESVALHMMSPNETVITILFHTLRGNIPLSDRYVDIGKPLMNDLGIGRLLQVLNTYVNANSILSKLNEEKIAGICYDVTSELNDIMWEKENRDLWALDVRDIPSIIKSTGDLIDITLQRATPISREGGEMGMQLDALAHQVQSREIIAKKGMSIRPLGGGEKNG